MQRASAIAMSLFYTTAPNNEAKAAMLQTAQAMQINHESDKLITIKIMQATLAGLQYGNWPELGAGLT